jgi:hypothetical protein
VKFGLIPREEDRLAVSEIRVLMRMFGLKDQDEEEDSANTNCTNTRFMIFTLIMYC